VCLYFGVLCLSQDVLFLSYDVFILPYDVFPEGLTEIRHHWFGMHFQLSYAPSCALMTSRNTFKEALLTCA